MRVARGCRELQVRQSSLLRGGRRGPPRQPLGRGVPLGPAPSVEITSHRPRSKSLAWGGGDPPRLRVLSRRGVRARRRGGGAHFHRPTAGVMELRGEDERAARGRRGGRARRPGRPALAFVAEARETAARLGYPVRLKRGRRGGKGMRLVANGGRLQSAFATRAPRTRPPSADSSRLLREGRRAPAPQRVKSSRHARNFVHLASAVLDPARHQKGIEE